MPSLSFEPVFRRSRGSLYKALARGRIDEERLRMPLVTNTEDGAALVRSIDKGVARQVPLDAGYLAERSSPAT